jgi:hypothetical protein
MLEQMLVAFIRGDLKNSPQTLCGTYPMCRKTCVTTVVTRHVSSRQQRDGFLTLFAWIRGFCRLSERASVYRYRRAQLGDEVALND